MQMSDDVRALDIEGQLSKIGTPTMGGIIIIISILVPTVLFCKIDNIYIILMLVTTIWLGVFEPIDDYVKVIKKNKEGIHGRYKLIAQLAWSLLQLYC